MRGLGDNLYQRALLHQARGVLVDTPWPELYADLDVQCVRASTTLRTQAQNVARSAYAWAPVPIGVRPIRLGYAGPELRRVGIVESLREQLSRAGIHGEPRWTLPPDLPRFEQNKPIAVVRPVTVRTEWRNEARNPRPEYLAQAAAELRARQYHVVSLAHLAPGEEWALDPLPEADTVWHAGELDVRQLLGLIQSAAVVVGGVGWIVPAAVSAGTPLYVIAGGNGAHNAPDVVMHPSMDASRVGWALPKPYCRCIDRNHNCPRTISAFIEHFRSWLDGWV
jgi:hypothetical protein